MNWCTFFKKILLVIVVFSSLPVVAQTGQQSFRRVEGITGTPVETAFINSAKAIILCKEGSVFTTNDAGATWVKKDVAPSKIFNGLSLQQNEAGDDTFATIVGNNGTIYSSTDGGTNWHSVTSGTTNNLRKITYGWCPSTHQSWGYAVGDNSTVLVSSDGGSTWHQQTTPYHYEHLYGVNFYDNVTGWIVGSSGIMYRTTNSGSAWNYVVVDQTNNPDYYGVYFSTPTNGYVVGLSGYLSHTSNGGSTWNKQNGGTTESLNDIDFWDSDTADAVPPSPIAVGDNGVAIADSNRDGTWKKIDLGTASKLNDVSIDPNGYLWIVGDNATVFTNRPLVLTPSAPSNLTATTKSSTEIDLSWLDNSNNELGFIIERKKGSSGSWDDADTAAANHTAYEDKGLESNAEYYYRVSSYSSGGESSYSNEVHATTGITDVSNLDIPKEFSLYQNYPNPFNPETTIKYSLPQRSRVKLEILDALGRVVSTLVDSEFDAGNYYYNWDASNFASGTYIYRIATDNFSSSKKLMLVK